MNFFIIIITIITIIIIITDAEAGSDHPGFEWQP